MYISTTCFHLGKLCLEAISIIAMKVGSWCQTFRMIPKAILEILNSPLKVKASFLLIMISCFLVLSRFLGRRRAVTAIATLAVLMYLLARGDMVASVVEIYDETERNLHIADRLLPEFFRCITGDSCIFSEPEPVDSSASTAKTDDEELRRSVRALDAAAKRARAWLAQLLDEGLPLQVLLAAFIALHII